MKVEYTYIISSFLTFFFGVFIGINLIKFFSAEITAKLEEVAKKQEEINKNYTEKSLKILIEKIDDKFDFFEQISRILQKIGLGIDENESKIKVLNKICDKRKELETEVIKFKNIIKRLEKKR